MSKNILETDSSVLSVKGGTKQLTSAKHRTQSIYWTYSDRSCQPTHSNMCSLFPFKSGFWHLIINCKTKPLQNFKVKIHGKGKGLALNYITQKHSVSFAYVKLNTQIIFSTCVYMGFCKSVWSKYKKAG